MCVGGCFIVWESSLQSIFFLILLHISIFYLDLGLTFFVALSYVSSGIEQRRIRLCVCIGVQRAPSELCLSVARVIQCLCVTAAAVGAVGKS